MIKTEIKTITQNIISALHFIDNRSFYREMRSRIASEQQQIEEFEDFEEDMTRIWFEAKSIYCINKVEIDKYLLENTFSKKSIELFIVMRDVIDNEMETIDSILLEETND
ncbi:hypothetical protein UFOVP53_156 [uncultured Caudovirales phage]|uniref:Uncharacterized protein n=1 Tax=uncultured Caudovirales phage TaxID=2100421 RepID=A0A6J5KZG5_9CAUD|nr:hypothetical protein UFOVP53_156 [uncultured Caudovirales phage]